MADLLKPWWKKNNDRGRLTILPESQTSLEEGGVTSRSCSNVNLKKGGGGWSRISTGLGHHIFYPKKTSTGDCLITMCKVQVVLTSKSLIYAKPSAWDCTEFIFPVTQCKGSTSFPSELRKWICVGKKWWKLTGKCVEVQIGFEVDGAVGRLKNHKFLSFEIQDF